MKRPPARATSSPPGRQSGAVLYVAMIMLILLAILGIVGMQVSTMQERMTSNFMATNLAFQNAEAQISGREAAIVSGIAYDYENCASAFDPAAWANNIASTVGSDIRTTNISICTAQCSAKAGADRELCNMYRTTAFSRDQASAADSTAAAAIDTIFIKP
ncbi:fimbrial protein [Pseudoxanthomonas winnipegensis]|jgi:type IV pilus assembly protein PilX|uniref:Fimbrial protein n=2 Tax=Pseudoxanthomonas winnipegensis TaxID=2480810 RepID=A0ABY1WGZ6_9GAMM|nr:PilX N-terminal domain-containing pilus assembly protein [Pseudoxanthomonas winnipegensis]RZZ88976.1 fimbrial protein [Pseudoxanthomonas winnipegensis]TAA10814.1 fimbrial protein [Pseudoxanthomonas winnipegensis]TAA22032.1 fimbrial protein [Pseudoxanthomonas winnipegensis]TAA43839.1 fimbrial protein [Pseudoxanthomonas winnipegensis]TAH74384.1 fimbrial protein [Pseudoxanthomonas winnipegensis]